MIKINFKIALIVILMLAVVSPVMFAQTKLVEKVEKKGDEIVIPYEKHELSNGLTLIIHQDNSDPIVYVDVTYHVGSAREIVGRSGFAHFFEHMMFQGSDNVADEEHFKIVSESGGTLNGTTNRDRTNYFETLPNNQLERALWLEADRMGFLLDAVTQKKFEVQRETVKNERGQRIDNRPYGQVGERVGEVLYPNGHPYSWPVIGWMDDLNNATLDDLKRFFLRWYGPNNATLTVAGDIDPKAVVAMTEKYFGSIPRGPEVNMPKAVPANLQETRYISYEDKIRFPLVQITYPTVPNRHVDEVPLDLLSEILGGGKNSLLYKNLKKPNKAIQTYAYHPCSELAGEFMLVALAMPGQTLADMEKIINESLAEFEKRGVTDDDVTRFKAKYEADLISSLSSVQGKGARLASSQTYTQNPAYILEEQKKYLSVTKEDVMRVYNQYIKGKHHVVMSVYPAEKQDVIAKADTYKAKREVMKVANDPSTDDLKYNKAKDNFDRSVKPSPGPNPVLKVPNIWEHSYDNGLKVIGSTNNELPNVSLRLEIKAGKKMESYHKGKEGIAQLTSSMLNESTVKFTSEEISSELEKLGSDVSFSSNRNSITMNISTLKKYLGNTLSLSAEMLMNPRFSEEDFERAKSEQLEIISNQANQAGVIANNVMAKVLYGDKHILSSSASGTLESVERITLDDVKNYYNTYFAPNIASLVIVGDVHKDEVISKLNYLNTWEKKDIKAPVENKIPAIAKTKIYLVDKPGAPQSEIRIAMPGLKYDAMGDYYKSYLMNYALGGAFNSRINLNLREDKGYTYGARSMFSGDEWKGWYGAFAAVRGNVTDSAVAEFVYEISEYQKNGITADELTFTKASIGQKDARDYETNRQKAAFINRILKYDLPHDFVAKQNSILQGMTVEDINEYASKYLQPDNMSIVVVGDKASIEEPLSRLGYEIVVLDTNGNLVTQ
ncbi:MAG: insulinase family protein [Bacteroidia bacterium]|nr:insulinase family protein [Bacteroidia bacterium]